MRQATLSLVVRRWGQTSRGMTHNTCLPRPQHPPASPKCTDKRSRTWVRTASCTASARTHEPFDYQRRLAEDPECTFRLIDIPTSCGKAAAVVRGSQTTAASLT